MRVTALQRTLFAVRALCAAALMIFITGLASERGLAPNGAPSAAPAASSAATGDANDGAKLVQANGCEGCHGAGLRGGAIGPALYGVEHRISADQIAGAIANPKAPMPNFGFTSSQISDIVAYLSGLDGGVNDTKPVVTIVPPVPTDQATLSVRFPGDPPQHVTVTPIMVMGSTTMPTREVMMSQSTSDPHVFTGKVVFSMGGPWTIHLIYDGHTLDVPLTVGS
jgi:mono/diheme cytochrome c family protein